MKKLLAIALVLVMLVGVMAGCGKEEAKGTTIKMWSMWNAAEPQGIVLQEAADAFHEKTGNTVQIEWKGREMNKIILAALEGGEDIDLFEEGQPRIARNYTEYMLDLSDMAKAVGFEEKSYACINNRIRGWTGGALNSIVEQPQIGGIFYNKTAFKEAGVEVPKTWTEFLDVCQKLVDAGWYPLALDSTYSDFNMGYHLARVIGQDKVTELAANGGWAKNEGAVKAADQLLELRNKGFLAAGAPDDFPNGQNKMGIPSPEGKRAAMIVCAQYVINEVTGASTEDVDFGYFGYPAVEGGADPDNNFVGGNGLGIPKASKNAQVAFDFIMFLTRGEFDQKMADAAEQIPAERHQPSSGRTRRGSGT